MMYVFEVIKGFRVCLVCTGLAEEDQATEDYDEYYYHYPVSL